MEEELQHNGEPFEMPDDLAISQEQERLISGLNPQHALPERTHLRTFKESLERHDNLLCGWRPWGLPLKIPLRFNK